jgi:hypothetical protein
MRRQNIILLLQLDFDLCLFCLFGISSFLLYHFKKFIKSVLGYLNKCNFDILCKIPDVTNCQTFDILNSFKDEKKFDLYFFGRIINPELNV